MLWGLEIGQLFWDEDRRNSYFFFSPDYFKTGYDISPILYPKGSRESRWAIYGNREEKIYQGLPPFLADSLPDKWGNAIFNDWFEKMRYREKDKNPLTKLSFIGNTAMGALEFIPMYDKGGTGSAVNMEELYKEAKLFEQKLSGQAVKDDEDMTTEALLHLGTSPGGSRSKAIVSRTPEGVFVSGKTALDPAFKHYLIKFNAPEYSISETEFTYHQLAVTAGIRMMPCELLTIKGTKHFMTERFDRMDGEKVFMQTLAAINPCEESYEELFRTCRYLNLDAPQMEEMFRRTAFNILMNNTDDHRKNFSFIMSKDGTWSLAPHYDVTFILETGNTPCRTHCMSLRGKREDIGIEDLLLFAEDNGIKHAQRIIDRIVESSREFPKLAKENGIRPDIAEIIENRLSELRPAAEFNATKSRHRTFRTKNGKHISDARFERSMKGNIHLVAKVNGFERKYVFTPKRAEYSKILESGFNDMTQEEFKKYIETFLISRTPPW